MQFDRTSPKLFVTRRYQQRYIIDLIQLNIKHRENLKLDPLAMLAIPLNVQYREVDLQMFGDRSTVPAERLN